MRALLLTLFLCTFAICNSTEYNSKEYDIVSHGCVYHDGIYMSGTFSNGAEYTISNVKYDYNIYRSNTITGDFSFDVTITNYDVTNFFMVEKYTPHPTGENSYRPTWLRYLRKNNGETQHILSEGTYVGAIFTCCLSTSNEQAKYIHSDTLHTIDFIMPKDMAVAMKYLSSEHMITNHKPTAIVQSPYTIFIDNIGSSESDICLHNMSGNILKTIHTNSTQHNLTIDCSGLPNNIYILTIRNEQGFYTFKIALQ